MAKSKLSIVEQVNADSVGNAAAVDIRGLVSYRVGLQLTGVADILFHRWHADAVDEKARLPKNSEQKKSDNVESYISRNERGQLCLPGEYVRQSIINAARSKSDPRSPRKSAIDLYKAGVIVLTELASFGVDRWDYLDKRRAVVQRSGVNRVRPAMRAGWIAEVQFEVLLPEYITPHDFHEVANAAGRTVGVGDFRPTYGRYRITRFEVLAEE